MKSLFILSLILLSSSVFGQSIDIETANDLFISGQIDDHELIELGYGASSEEEGGADESSYTDGVFRSLNGTERFGFSHSTGTKQYTWFRLTFSDTEYRSNTPHSTIINSFNGSNERMNKESYGQFGFDRLCIIDLHINLTYDEVKNHQLGIFPLTQPLKDSIDSEPRIILDTTYNYYRLYDPTCDDPNAERFYLHEMLDHSNNNHWYFQANTNGGFWLAPIGGNRIFGGDTQVSLVHEWGHNCGLGHQPRLSGGEYTPSEKEKIGWFNNNENYQIANQSGEYTLYPYGENSAEIEGLKIYRNDGSYFWATYEYGAKDADYNFGLLLREGSTEKQTIISTMEGVFPDQYQVYAPILEIGRTFIDYENGIIITPTEITYDEFGNYQSLKVNIQFGEDANNIVPTSELFTTNTHPEIGETIELRTYASDENGDELHYSWKLNGEMIREDIDTNIYTFTTFEAGLYIFEVSVSDAKGGISSNQVVVNYGNVDNNPIEFTGSFLDTDSDPVHNGIVNIAQVFSAIPSNAFNGPIDAYIFDGDNPGYGTQDFIDLASGAPTSVNAIDYPANTPVAPSDRYIAQWNGSLNIPVGGAYIRMSQDPHKKVATRIYFDINNDGIYSTDGTGGDVFEKSSQFELLTEAIFIPEGNYNFVCQIADTKGGGLEDFPHQDFALMWDLDSPTGQVQKLVELNQKFSTNQNGEYSVLFNNELQGENIVVNINHDAYSIDRTDMNNILLTKKFQVSLLATNGTVATENFRIVSGDSAKITTTPNNGHILTDILINGVSIAPISGVVAGESFVYQTPPITGNTDIQFVYSPLSFGHNLLINPEFSQPNSGEWVSTNLKLEYDKSRVFYEKGIANGISQTVDLTNFFSTVELNQDLYIEYSADNETYGNDNRCQYRTRVTFFDENGQSLEVLDRGNYLGPTQINNDNLPMGTKTVELLVYFEGFTKERSRLNGATLSIHQGLLQNNLILNDNFDTLNIGTYFNYEDGIQIDPTPIKVYTGDFYDDNGTIRQLKKNKSRLLSVDPVNNSDTRLTVSIQKNENKTFIFMLDSTSFNYLSEGEYETFEYDYVITTHPELADGIYSTPDTAKLFVTLEGVNDAPIDTAGIDNQMVDVNEAISILNLNNHFEDEDNGSVLTFSGVDIPAGINIDGNSGAVSGSVANSGEYTMYFVAEDEFGLTDTLSFKLTVEDIGLVFSLDNQTILENEAENTLIGSLTNDANFTYSIDGESDDFAITGNNLVSKRPFDFELEPVLKAKIKVEHINGNIRIDSFDINVLDKVLEAPKFFTLSNHILDSDLPTGTLMGELLFSQQNNENVEFTLHNQLDKFEIIGTELVTVESLGFNSDKYYDLEITGTTVNGDSLTRIIEVVINKRTEQPLIDLLYVGTDTLKNGGYYTYIGDLVPEKGYAPFTYELISGAVNNNLFSLENDKVFLNDTLIFDEIPNNPLEISAKITDAKDSIIIRNFTFTVIDTNNRPFGVVIEENCFDGFDGNALEGTLLGQYSIDDIEGDIFTISSGIPTEDFIYQANGTNTSFDVIAKRDMNLVGDSALLEILVTDHENTTRFVRKWVQLNVDTIAPTPDTNSLADITSECSVSTLSAPSATDNCSNNITITNNANFPIEVSTQITWTYEDENGNVSTQNQEVIINPISATVTQQDSLLSIVSPETNWTFQWINCENNSDVIDATQSEYIATENGQYAVIVNNGNCSDTSECFTIDLANTEKIELSSLNLYPNPASDNFTIDSEGIEINSIIVFNQIGKEVMRISPKSSQHIVVDTKDLTDGVYFVRVKSNDRFITKKVIIRR